MKQTFEELKQELIEKAKPHNPCSSEYKRVLLANNEADLLKVIYDNIGWCSENKVVDNTYLGKFDAATLLASGCANTGLENSGLANSGNRNSGNWNSGYRNSEIAGTVRFEPSVLPYPYWEASGENIDGSTSDED